MALAAPTILEHGPDELRRRFLRSIATGEAVWCQLFSEPGAGSDLAGLTTRAELDGDVWRVSGQKVWNTGAVHADFGLLLARTDWDAPKHRGITYFVLPMKQAGVEVRPLRQMNGHASFNEVFLDQAQVPAAYVIGQVNDGWRGALTTLMHERRLAPARRPAPARQLGGRAWREAIAERVAVSEPHKWYPQRGTGSRRGAGDCRRQSEGPRRAPRDRQAHRARVVGQVDGAARRRRARARTTTRA
jgi:alkylation response protein AidB-like acyl-CoA dehydrogenase